MDTIHHHPHDIGKPKHDHVNVEFKASHNQYHLFSILDMVFAIFVILILFEYFSNF